MSQTGRLHFIAMSYCITILMYWFVNLMVNVPKYCWGLKEFWLNSDNFITPFVAFNTVFLLMFIWTLVETIILLRSQGSKKIQSWILSVFYIAIGLMTVIQYTLWQTIQILDGKLVYDDYLYKPLPQYYFDREKDNGHPLSRKEFIKQERCKNNLGIVNIPQKELDLLYEKYDLLNEELMNKE